MLAAAAAYILRAYLAEWMRRAWKLLAKIALGICTALVVGCTTTQLSVTVQLTRPGGMSNLLTSEVLQSEGYNPQLPTLPVPGAQFFVGPVQGAVLPAPPPDQWVAMQDGALHAPCAFPGPVWLAAIAWVESSYGANPGPSSAGAWGYGQFMPELLSQYGISHQAALDYRVMLPAMADYLCKSGITRSIDGALFAYNHSTAYVNWIKVLVGSWGTARPPAWHDLPAFNQFDPHNWASATNYAVWHAAACSAAALDWMLNAYGHPIASLDAALFLIGPNTGISASVGLLDHRGPALKTALDRAGLPAWNQQLRSTAELRQKLQDGPAMLDGAAWFGVGHWFVAIGSDDGGITVRESSGNNFTYLTWSRLYGEVGWSGWAVGVVPASTPSNQA